MSRHLAILSVIVCLHARLVGQTPPTRILPLGDSITYGFAGTTGFGGYRGRLRTLLTNAGYNVDYVGTQTDNGESLPDRDHEGHRGWRIDMLDSNIGGWLAATAPPDVVLLHIGTNDIGFNFDAANAVNRLDALILKIATLRPYAHIIVTNLMERGEPVNTGIQTLFNPFVQARVNAHAAAGRRVTFLDMRAACGIADMPDLIHPNQAGYDKMADAWLTAIQSVMTPLGDNLPPALVLVTAPDATHVVVTFSKPLEDAASSLANFSINGLGIYGAALDVATKRVVTLTTSPMTAAAPYTLTVSGVRDRTAAARPIAVGLNASFTASPIRGAVNNVAEAAGFTLLYSLNLPNAAAYNTTPPVYDIDNRIGVGPFTRVVYYLELQSSGQPLQYCWVSMDPFASDPALLGVPHGASGAHFQQPVANINVVSNVAGVMNGSNLSGGNIEFWFTDYYPANSAAVPGAGVETYDFGDQPVPGGYGSMQIHNSAAAQTLIAFNRWGSGDGDSDLGIGNGPGVNPDWTLSANAAAYTIRNLQVFVKTEGDLAGPTPLSATLSASRAQIVVAFSEPLVESSIVTQNFTVNAGVSVRSAVLRANLREVVLAVTPSPPGVPLTLTISGVRDRSPHANLIAPETSVAVSASALPAIIGGNVPESSSYQLACQLDIPATQSSYNTAGTSYTIDSRADIPGYDRIAYFLELANGGASTFVWVSGDAFTADPAKIAVPDVPSGAFFQRPLNNMNVVSNVAGIVAGNGLSGWLEFWPSDYAQANAASVPGASPTLFDFGDQTYSGAGYGSMQIHNLAAAQTIFAYNRWGWVGSADLGIGNRPTAAPDWTFAANAASYTTRRLSVLVRPSDASPPMITGAASGAGLAEVLVTFSEAVSEGAVIPANFTLTGGVGVTAAKRLGDGRTVRLSTTAQTAGTLYTLLVSGVADNAGNLIAPGSTATFTAVNSPPGPMVAPVVISQPISRSVSAGTATSFLVAAAGTPPFTYQWRRDGVPIAGANGQAFTIANAQAGAGGGYDALVTNAAGTAPSLAASLTITGLKENALSLRLQFVPGTGPVLNYTASPRQPFTVQRSIDLVQWINIANVSADAAGTVSYADPNPPGGRVFYRLLRVNP